MSSTRTQHVQKVFEAAITRLDAVMAPWGFVFESDGVQWSHCGPFACGHYVRGATRIGLSCRDMIDNVHYQQGFIQVREFWNEIETFCIGHDTLMHALGHRDDCRLMTINGIPDPDVVTARDNGDRVEALLHDWQQIAATVLYEPNERFYEIMRLGGRSFDIAWHSD